MASSSGKQEAEYQQNSSGGKPTAQASHFKNLRTAAYYRSLPPVPSFPWCECYQPQSAIANCKDEPLLVRVIVNYLSLSDALRLGKTCRRMYHLYRRSCTEARKSLVLVVGKKQRSRASQAAAPALVSFATLFADIFRPTDSNSHCLSRQTRSVSRLDIRTSSGDLPQSRLGRLLTATLPSLTYLELSAPMGLPSLPSLCRTLNAGCFGRLETLKLYLHCADNHTGKCRSVLARTTDSYCQLNLPSLRHLTLALLDGQLIFLEEDDCLPKLSPSPASAEPSLSVIKRTKAYSPLTIRTGRLTSLHLSTADGLPRLCSLIQQYVLLAREQHGMGEGSASSSNPTGNDIQIAHHLRRSHAPELQAMLRSGPHLLAGYAQALAYISQLAVEPRTVLPQNVLLLLPLMRRLRTVSLSAGATAHDAVRYYPALLAALAHLPRLSKLSVDFTSFGECAHLIEYLPARISVLPSVRELELHFPIRPAEVACWQPLLLLPQQADIVGQLQLAHCFPGLTAFRVLFEQLSLTSMNGFFTLPRSLTQCGVRELEAARALVRGFARLPVEWHKRAVTFLFKDPRFNIYYMAMDNSVLLVHSANKWLPSRRN